ncbi:MAG: hypothetical protein KDI64_05375, partial [Candidatus Accumulibacter sp.]|nr:hypothetical protein [Accumulibacter sp.]
TRLGNRRPHPAFTRRVLQDVSCGGGGFRSGWCAGLQTDSNVGGRMVGACSITAVSAGPYIGVTANQFML